MTETATAIDNDSGGGIDPGRALRKFGALQRREFADHRVAFFWAPVLVAGLIVLGLLGAAIEVSFFDGALGDRYINIDGEVIIDGDEIEIDGEVMTREEFRAEFGGRLGEKFDQNGEEIMTVFSSLITSPLLLILPFIVVFPLLSSLYDERMDRSFLFWKSMPVGDGLEVASKLFFIVVLGPLMLFALMGLVNLVAATIFTPVAWIHGLSAWKFIWAPTPFVSLWIGYALNYMIYAAWALPVLAWLMLASAVAPKAPLLVATIPVGAVAIFEQVFLDHSYLLEALGDRLGRQFGFIMRDTMERTSGGTDGIQVMTLEQAGSAFLESVGDPSLWIGFVVAGVILYGAVLLRRFRV